MNISATQTLRLIYYPILLIASVAVFFAFKDLFPGEQLALLTAAISVVVIAIIHITERLLPYRREWNTPQGDRTSNFIFTNIVLPGLSKVVEIMLTALFLNQSSALMSPGLQSLWPRQWPLLSQLALALFITEFFFYWVHRIGHRWALAWRFHSIHHAVERLYWDNAGRFHPVDLFLNWLFYFLPLFLLAVPPELIALFLLVNAVTGLLEHANVDFEMGPLNRVFNTAQLHRWHHSVVPEISSQNFGKVLSIWDQVFGTWYHPEGKHVGKIGVEGEDIPKRTWGQMLYPFRRRP
ncbi:sterol desaturase family protein [Bdellovibrio bacteriovorus]|uniref:sterol desaturase family protein n=1 Tax=Bdellovibrio bacteriovorus TaxID=959 RepID=UPI0021D0880D|nr:sterol desaturase family protein [Bdellovibrio bacteriovorus]UXR65064.1 sterol desaturase family protein [Bdellovibrio bacteriovorus]